MKITPPNYFKEEKDFPIAYENVVRFCLKEGMVISTEYGTKSKDICSTIIMTGLAIQQIKNRIMHPKFPTKGMHLQKYIMQFTPEFDASKFEYTYYERLTRYYLNECNNINQLQYIKENLKNSKRLQAITWIPDFDLESKEPPCLQRIWIRLLEEPDNDNYIHSKGQVEVHFTWRSRDLYSAWMSNLVGLILMIYNEILGDDYEIIKIVDFVNAAHVYQTDWQAADLV